MTTAPAKSLRNGKKTGNMKRWALFRKSNVAGITDTLYRRSDRDFLRPGYVVIRQRSLMKILKGFSYQPKKEVVYIIPIPAHR
jgi:hypothetical protein